MHFILCKRNTSVTVIKGFYLEFGHINWYNNCVDNNKFFIIVYAMAWD